MNRITPPSELFELVWQSTLVDLARANGPLRFDQPDDGPVEQSLNSRANRSWARPPDLSEQND